MEIIAWCDIVVSCFFNVVKIATSQELFMLQTLTQTPVNLVPTKKGSLAGQEK